jgi:hypothetical protein
MRDLHGRNLMILKAFLFLLLGILAAGILLWESPELRTAALLCIVIWSFSRAYYFAFYVIEHYLDPSLRFSGLMSAARFLMPRRRRS